MSDLILLLLMIDAGALLLLTAFAALLPTSISAILVVALCGAAALLNLLPLAGRFPAGDLVLPAGPAGLSLHLALDPLSMFFLVIVLLAAAAVAMFQATPFPQRQGASIRRTALCAAGMIVSITAADGVTLALGAAAACGAVWRPRTGQSGGLIMLVPVLLPAAVCLLTQPGELPGFDVIRTGAGDPDRATASIALTIAAVATLVFYRPHKAAGDQAAPWTAGIDETGSPLIAGILTPFATYLLLRMTTDLAGSVMQPWWGYLLLLGGGATAAGFAWLAASEPEMDTVIAAMTRRQAGLSAAGVGLVVVARVADLPGAGAFALQATYLTAIGTSLSATLTTLAAQVFGAMAGTVRLSRLGGLIHTMPTTSAAMAAGLLTLAALPPGLGFASLWLLFQSILFAPRTGGLLAFLPLALIAGAIALSAALATAASIRVIGIAVLGRPRTPQAAGAREAGLPARALLLTMGIASVVAGVLPGPLLWLLAEPAVQAVTNVSPGRHAGLVWLSMPGATSGYLALPVSALLALATGAAMLVPRWAPRQTRIAGPWTDGMPLPPGLPFGEPAAQSAGEGFVPRFPDTPRPRLPRFPAFAGFRLASAVGLIWLLLASFAMLLLVLAILQ